MKNFADKLVEAVRRTGAPVCVGIDPHFERIPASIFRESRQTYESPADAIIETVESFCIETLDVLQGAGIAIVKPQVAFFEALGPNGLASFERVCERARGLGMLVIADIKRGDIGSTSTAYANGWLGGTQVMDFRLRPFSVDAVTVNPYVGFDGLAPFINAANDTGRGVFVLLKTSNPGSVELQDLKLESGETIYASVARRIARLGEDFIGECGYSMIGAVVGATDPRVSAELRELLPRTVFLVPGYGAQGAGAKDIAHLFDRNGMGALVTSSRGVIHAYGDASYTGDWKGGIHRAALALRADISAALPR